MIAKKHSLPALAAALVFAAFACGIVLPAFAANTIRILVNDQPITSYDIEQRTKMMRVFTGGKAGEKEATDQLIDEQLMLQEAGRRHIDVTEDEIDKEIATRARAGGMTAAQFSQAMRQAGFDPKTFRQFLRANLSWQRIVRARFRATVNITDQDVTAALSSRTTADAGTEQSQATEYMLQQILFLVPSGANDRAANERLSQANAFRSAFQGCDQAVQQAGGAPGIVVRPPTRREEAALPAALRTSLAALDVGGTTNPERVQEGYQVLAICAKNAIAGQSEAAVAVRDELSGERGQLLARRYLRDLRSDAVIEYR